jgi:hypothetical protein
MIQAGLLAQASTFSKPSQFPSGILWRTQLLQRRDRVGFYPTFLFTDHAVLHDQHLIIWIQFSNFHVSILTLRKMTGYKNSALFYDYDEAKLDKKSSI